MSDLTPSVICDDCGAVHPAEFSHLGQFDQAPVYAVVCPVDGLTGYYTTPALLAYTTATPPPAVVIDYGPEQTRCELDDPQTGGVCQRRLTPRGHCPLHDKA